ncbi:MAG: hypothetical protein IKN86_02275 [Bacteroidaceae bacterium]|nr:hypothetical protein [Bacteroidaceae bacterium]
MELILKRIAKKKTYTIGKLYASPLQTSPSRGDLKDYPFPNTPLLRRGAGGEADYFCDTLEPPVREVKTKSRGGITQKPFAIPEGRYPVVITYSPKFKKWLPLLLNVPQFSGIRIHAGNTPRDTAGCILVGENKQVGQLLNSTLWLNRLKQKIVEAKERGEGVWITVKN